MISSRRQSHYREAMVFEDDWGNSASEREVSSPWIQRRKQSARTSKKSEESKLRQFLSKIELKHKCTVSTKPMACETIKPPHKTQSLNLPIANETTFIAFPCGPHQRQFVNRKLVPDHLGLKQQLQLRRVVIENPLGLKIMNKTHVQPKDYKLSLFQKKWRAKETKKQQKRKRSQHSRTDSVDYYFASLHSVCFDKCSQDINCNVAKTLRLNKNVYMKITERRKDSTGREFKESEFDDESTLRQSTLNKQFNWVQQTNSKRYNRLHTAVDSMCKKQSFGQSVSSFC